MRKPPYFDGMPAEPAPVTDIHGARVLAVLGDSVTTDHISPAGAIKTDSPAGQYLTSHGIERRDFNTYGSRRGNHEVMIRGTFANIRLRNQLAPGTEGSVTLKLPEGTQTSIYEASRAYIDEGTPLVVLGGKEYGSGSSRDWAAKGTALLGVRAVLVESFERIHRSNLIGMGVLPLQFLPGESIASLGLTGHEVFDVTGIEALNSGQTPREVTVRADGKEFKAIVRIDTPGEAEYYRHGGIMQYVLRSLLAMYQVRKADAGLAGVRGTAGGALLIGGILVVSFNMRAAITSLPPVFPELRHAAGLSTATLAALAAVPVLSFARLLRPRSGRSPGRSARSGSSSWPCSARGRARAALGRARRAAVPGHDPGRGRDLAGQRAAAEPGQTPQAGAGRVADRPVPDVADRRRGARRGDRGAGVQRRRRAQRYG